MLSPSVGLLDHDVLGQFGDFRHVLHRLAQRRGGERECAVFLQLRALELALADRVGPGVFGRVLGLDVRDVLQRRPGRQAVLLDDAGVAHAVCTPKASRIEPATICSFALSCVENATSITKKLIIRPIRSAKVTNQP